MTQALDAARVPLPLTDLGELRRRLGWLLVLRALIATALSGATVAANVAGGVRGGVFDPERLFLYGIVGAVYAATIGFAVLRRTWDNVRAQAWLQLAFDLLVCTAFVYITGGVDSIFLFVYTLTIINASTLFFRQGALATAAVAWGMFGALVAAEANGWIPARPGQQGPNAAPDLLEIAFTLCMAFAGFHLVALLSGTLSEQLRRTGIALAAERLIRETQEALHQTVLKALSDGLVVASLPGRITFSNRAASVITGLDEYTLLGSTLQEMFPAVADVLRDARAGVDAWTGRVEAPHRRPDGVVRQLAFSLSRHLGRAGDAQAGWLVIFQDVTELRELERTMELRSRLAAIGEVSAGLAHEIRNPLASLSGSIELLRGRAAIGGSAANDGSAQRLMDIALRETERLNQLVSDFLAYARPSPPHAETVDLNRLVDETLTVLMNDPDQLGGCRIVRQLAPEVVRARADVAQVKQVLWNLALNAVQAMPNGGAVIVSTGERVADKVNRMAMIEVRDSGVGIAPEDLRRIFDPFFTTKARGTGLGLATVYRIVQGLGGLVQVESSVGRGTLFRVLLPLETAAPVAASSASAEDAARSRAP